MLITGGTSGIGLALADSAGASVAVCARSEEGLASFAETRPSAFAIKADIANRLDQEALFDAVASRFGRLDVLVNNAGRLIERDFARDSADPASLADEFALNLVAPIQLTASALQRWPELDGIVFMGSGFGLVSPGRAPTYGAAKAGLHGFAEGLRRQLAGGPTHVLEVLPPVVDTPATAHRSTTKVSAHAVAAATLDALRQGRPMALIGQTRLLPTLLRIAPATVGRIVGQR